jgi:hypothetical protein
MDHQDLNLGYSVSSAGDVNGDCYDDIIIGSYYMTDSFNFIFGRIYVIFGHSNSNPFVDIYNNEINGSDRGFQVCKH